MSWGAARHGAVGTLISTAAMSNKNVVETHGTFVYRAARTLGLRIEPLVGEESKRQDG